MIILNFSYLSHSLKLWIAIFQQDLHNFAYEVKKLTKFPTKINFEIRFYN